MVYRVNSTAESSPLPPALPKKKVYVKNKWEDMGKFSSMDDVLKLLPKSDWALHYDSKTKDGVKKVYRCTKSKRVGPQCIAKRQVLVSSSDWFFYLSKNGDLHSHDDSKPIRGLSIDAQKIIKDKYDSQDRRLTALPAKRALTRNGIDEGTLPQITYQLKKLRKNNPKGPEYSIIGLETWFKERESIPQDLDVPFVLKSEVLSTEGFKFVISTRRLLQNAIDQGGSFLHADATHKICYEKRPLIVVGTSDKNRKFHPIAFCFTRTETESDYFFCFSAIKDTLETITKKPFNPKTLQADASFAIHNGFVKAFGTNTNTLMCWFHVRNNLKKNVRKLVQDPTKSKEILDDIYFLQVAATPADFETALNLFLKKHSKEAGFVDYFKSEWVTKHPNWYEGILRNFPSTNNALESFNNVIKQHHTYREREKANEFCETLEKIVSDFSIDYKGGVKKVDNTPFISDELWRKGCAFKHQKNIIRKGSSYRVEIGQHTQKTKGKFANFDEYKKSLTTLTLHFPNKSLEDADCTCSTFLKRYVCEHLIGIALKEKFIECPENVTRNFVHVVAKKNGRPQKAKKALIMQD